MLLKVKEGWDAIDLLQEKNNFVSLLRNIWIKAHIFHWKAHFVILVKSLFKSFVALLILCLLENNEVSFAKSFGLY